MELLLLLGKATPQHLFAVVLEKFDLGEVQLHEGFMHGSWVFDQSVKLGKLCAKTLVLYLQFCHDTLLQRNLALRCLLVRS
jgi:hypothetical protein